MFDAICVYMCVCSGTVEYSHKTKKGRKTGMVWVFLSGGKYGMALAWEIVLSFRKSTKNNHYVVIWAFLSARGEMGVDFGKNRAYLSIIYVCFVAQKRMKKFEKIHIKKSSLGSVTLGALVLTG